jgi:hypothetical protein
VVRCCAAFSYLETRRCRVLLAALFISMGVVNAIAVLSNPRAYTDLYGDRAWLPFYRSILNGFVADNARFIVIPWRWRKLLLESLTLGLC